MLSFRYEIARALRCAAVVVFVSLLSLASVYAQNRNTGEIRGTITDPSGAAVAGAKIFVKNTLTGIATAVTSGAAGVYDAPLLAAGEYSLEFSKDGFKKFVRNGVTLHIEAITVDAVLTVGSVNETLTVTADVPLVQTETSTRTAVFTQDAVNDLPNVGRSWFDITGQLPGVSPGGNANGGGQDASGMGVGVNGMPGFQESFLTDGGVNTLPVSQNPGVGVPLDDIAEVDMNTSNFSAESGNGVAVFNVITKSGTNRFHGSVYDFEQNNMFEARNYFAQTVEPLHWHMYGGTLGGPIRRDKAFFFFSFQRNPIISNSPSYSTYPTSAMKGVGTPNGGADFSALLGAPEYYLDSNGNPTTTPVINPCNNQQEIFGQIYDPATQQTVGGQPCRMPFANNIIPANRFDSVANAIQAYFPTPNQPGLGNNVYFAGRGTSSSNIYSGKLDYNVSASNRLSGSVQMNPSSGFSPSPTCPIGTGNSGGCQTTSGEATNVQITDAWTLNSKLINEFRISFLRQFGAWSTPSTGKGYPAKIGLPNVPETTAADTFPNINIGGYLSTSLGSGLFAELAFNSFMYSDSVTWSTGKHVWKFGGEFDKWQDNQVWQGVDAGDFGFSGNFTANSFDFNGTAPTGLSFPAPQREGYADFLLGQVDNWGVSIPPRYGARTWGLAAFAQDDYKVTPHLTLNLGVRYSVLPGWTEIQNRFGTFEPDMMNPGTGTLGAICYAGQTFGNYHCPQAQTKTIADVFHPRVGFAWSPKSTWSIRGAYGMFGTMRGANNYINSWFPGWQIQGSLPTISVTTPVFTLANGAPAGSIVYPGPAARTPDALNGQGAVYIPYNTPTAYTQQWHFGIQHEMFGRVGLDAAYVGSRGTHLPFGRDLNQVPEALLGPNDSPGSRPYPQYPGGLGAALFDGISFYNSFQFSARAQATHNLSFRFNYTFSKGMDEYSSAGWCCISDTYQNSYNIRANYGLTAFDVPQLLNGSLVYALPFGAGKSLLNQGGLLDKVVGGWQVSGVFQIHSGIPFTPYVSNNETFAYAGTEYPNRVPGADASEHRIINPDGTPGAVVSTFNPLSDFWYNTQAFASPSPYTFGDSGRHILRGPKWRNLNFALEKNFKITKLGEGGQLQVRVDAYDIFNHPNFGMPDSSIDTGTSGQITSANTSRNLQLGAKLSF